MAVGGECIDLEWDQVHATGLVHPDEPDAKVKFLAAEALRVVCCWISLATVSAMSWADVIT